MSDGPIRTRGRAGAANRPRRGGGGFTLVELLVVVAIISLLLSLLVPVLSRARELTRRAHCAANLHALGRGWCTYWQEYDNGFPGLTRNDAVSQSCIYIYHNHRIVNTGRLWKAELLPGEKVFVCPTTDGNTSDPWFDDEHGAYPPWRSPNPWPPGHTGYHHCRMTYCTRRMNAYDRSDVPHSSYERERPFMLRTTGVGGIANAAGFSFMADNVNNPELAKMSHYPGVNVLYLDGHVRLFLDESPDGEVLYHGNGIDASHSSANNWALDQVWVKIDERR